MAAEVPTARRPAGALLAIAASTLLLSACAPTDALSSAAVEPSVITPDQDGDADVARLSYEVGSSSAVTITLVGTDGTEHALRWDRPRAAGRYEALFGGVIDGRMLPDGDYRVRFEAVPAAGQAVVLERPLSLRGGDVAPPVLAALSVMPSTFTPNQDGIDDRVAISYRLDEPAEVRLWLADASGRYVADIIEERQSAEDAGAVGPHVYDYDAGVDADAPPPADGDYSVVAEARDRAGNVSRVDVPLAIRRGGQPRAAIVGDVAWSAAVVALGQTLTFTATVANVGATPIRTRGPEPGFVYDNRTNFNQQAPSGVLLVARAGDRVAARRVPLDESDGGPITLCGTVEDGGAGAAGVDVYGFEPDGDRGVHARSGPDGRFCLAGLRLPPGPDRTYARSPGAVRLGLEYDERAGDVEYPFRWSVGRLEDLDACEADGWYYLCLAPGGRARVTGGVRFVEPPLRRTTNVYLALMHEDVRRMHGPYSPRRITVEH